MKLVSQSDSVYLCLFCHHMTTRIHSQLKAVTVVMMTQQSLQGYSGSDSMTQEVAECVSRTRIKVATPLGRLAGGRSWANGERYFI